MDRKTEHIVRLRAGGVCEYCRLPQSVSPLIFPLDHVIARQHGGVSTENNLAVACPSCNLHKGPNLASIDPEDGQLVRLFNPRIDRWSDHFEWRGPLVLGVTPVGRVTVQCLAMNERDIVALRKTLMSSGFFPRDPTSDEFQDRETP
jgi:hypothetical protein